MCLESNEKIREFLSQIEFRDDREQKECLKYIELKGLRRHMSIFQYIKDSGIDIPRYSMVAGYYRYDKRLRYQLFIYISMYEEYLRAKLGNSFDLGHNFPPKEIKAQRKTISYADSSTLEQQDLNELIETSKQYPGMLPELSEVDANMAAFRKLRNVISHQKFLMMEELKECYVDGVKAKTLYQNIKNVQCILPPSFQHGFAESIRKCGFEKAGVEMDIMSKDRIDLQ